MFQGTGALAFNAAFYLQNNPDVFQAIQNGTFQGSALDHFVQFGQFEGRDPNAFFDTEYYLENNPDVLVAIADPANPSVVSAFQHFVDFGAEEGVVRAPSAEFAGFNAQTYLDANPDLQAAFGNLTGEALEDRLFQHFVEFGVNENRPGSGVNVDGGLPGQSFTLTTAIETLNGTANNDTFDAPLVVNQFSGFQQNSLQTGDVINGGAGTDTLNATLSVAPAIGFGGSTAVVRSAAPTLNSVENVNVRFLDLGFGDGEGDTFELDLSNSTGVQSVSVNASTAAGIISGLGAASTFAVTNSVQDVDFEDTTSSAITVNVSNYGSADNNGDIEFDPSTAIKSLTLSSNNSTFDIDTTSFGSDTLTSLTLNVTGENTIDVNSASAVQTAVVTGSGSVDLTDTDFGNALKSFDASANQGGVNVDLSGRGFGSATPTALTVSGGAGDDRFEFGVLDAKVVVNGGAGFDTVAVSAGSFLTEGQNIGFNALTNVERLEFVNAPNSSDGATITGTFLTNPGITNILFNTAGSDTINAAGSARTYEFGVDNGGNATFNMKAGAETLNIDLLGETLVDGDETFEDGASVENIIVSPAAATGTVAINIESLGGLSGTLELDEDGAFNIVGQVTARGGSTITLTGDSALLFGGVTNSGTADGATFTTGFTINASGLQAETILRGSTNGDTITLGTERAGVAFEAGDSGEVAGGNIVNFDVITGFTAGTDGDVLGFGNGEFTALTTAQQTAITNGAANLLQAFELAADAITTNGGVGWTAFTFGGQTYAAYSDGVDGADALPDFTGGDLVVQLNGVGRTDLTAANFDTDPFGS